MIHEFIKLDSLLKYAAVVQTGSDDKFFISEGLVLVDGEVETRRGRKNLMMEWLLKY